MPRDDGHLPGLPVAIPRPTSATSPADPLARRTDSPEAPDDPDAPLDWRIGGAVGGLLWAAFSSLMLSVAPPTWSTFTSWALVSTVFALVVGRQWFRCALHAGELPPSAARQPLEDRPATRDMHRIEKRLDEDPT